MKKLFVVLLISVFHIPALCWDTYEMFVIDATNALEHGDFLVSDSYTNQLWQCQMQLHLTNEIGSASLLLLAISEQSKTDTVEGMVGNRDFVNRLLWFKTSVADDRTLWQKVCALTLLSTENRDSTMAHDYFSIATNVFSQWNASTNCFNGGILYEAIARHYGAPELSARQSLIFTAADAAKKAGLLPEFMFYRNMLPPETRNFLEE